MKARTLILLTLLLAFGCAAGSGISLVFGPKAKLNLRLYEEACKISKTDCDDILPPFIMVTDTSPNLGYYVPGTNVVFISEDCMSPLSDLAFCDGITIHEFVHYLDWATQRFPEDPFSCLTEGNAWKAYNKYVKKIKRRDLIRTQWWKEYYPCGPSQKGSKSSVTK